MDNAKSIIDVFHNDMIVSQAVELAVLLIQYARNHPLQAGLLAMLALAYFWGVIGLVGWIVGRLTLSAKPAAPPEPAEWVIDIRDSAGNVIRTVTLPAEQVGRMTRAWGEQRKRR